MDSTQHAEIGVSSDGRASLAEFIAQAKAAEAAGVAPVAVAARLGPAAGRGGARGLAGPI